MQTSQQPRKRQKLPIESVAAGVPAVKEKIASDENDRKEVNDLNDQERLAKIEGQNQLNKDKETNRDLRSKFATRVFNYLIFYSIFVASLLVLSGFKYISLSDGVLTTMVGSTAVAAIGLVGFVVNGLFKNVN